MKKMSKVLAALCVAAGSSLLAAPAYAAGTSTAATASTCDEYKAAHAGQGTWVCVDGAVTTYKSVSGQYVAGATTQLSPKASSSSTNGLVTPQTVADKYTSNVNKTIEASIGGVSYSIPVTLRTRLYNHSPYMKFSYTSSKPVSVYWRYRIQRENTLSGDDTVYTYQYGYGPTAYETNYSEEESQYGEGYNKLPYDSKSYHMDAYQLRLSSPTGVVNVLFSVKSDSMTCYKTSDCKFK